MDFSRVFFPLNARRRGRAELRSLGHLRTLWDSTFAFFTEDGDDELGACDVGHYSDFGCFRDTITRHMTAADFPVLMTHSDCDGEWTVEQLPALVRELETIGARFRSLPPEEPQGAFEHTAEYRVDAALLYDCFHDVDGSNLFEALIGLCKQGISSQRPITFQ